METKDYLTNYYERYDENGRLISKHGMIEYITTMKYVKKYLQPGMRILEIGAATGRYSYVNRADPKTLCSLGKRMERFE